MSPAVDISEVRGFALGDDFSGNLCFILVKLPIETFVEGLKAFPDITVAEPRLGEEDYYVSSLFQLRGHPWTVILSGGTFDKYAAEFSGKLGVPVLSWAYGDTADWQDLCYYENGEIIEHYAAGCDYDGELADYAEEMGEDPPEDTDRGVPWDTVAHDDTDKYVFRSTVRTATEVEIVNLKAFRDKLLIERDACIPDWDHAAVFSEMTEVPEHFVAVYELK